jgi:hypothetical protein
MNSQILYNALSFGASQALMPQRLIGLNSGLWQGTGISSVAEACVKSTSDTTVCRSLNYLPAYPEMRFLIKGTMTTTNIIIATAATAGNGYKVSFPSTTSIKLERADSGSGGTLTEIATGTLPVALTATDWITVVVRAVYDRIEVEVDGTLIISADTTHRLTTWYLYLDHADYIYMLVGHLLCHVDGVLTYQSVMQDANFWYSSGMSAVTPGITIAAGWDLQYLPFLLPKSGWRLSIDITPGATGHYATWGVCTPDRKFGLYVKWLSSSGNKWRMYDMQDSLLESSSDTVNYTSFTLEAGTDAHATVYATCGIYSLSGSHLAKLMPNMMIFTKGDDANGCVLNGITITAAASSMLNHFNSRYIAESGASMSGAGANGLPLPSVGNGGLL